MLRRYYVVVIACLVLAALAPVHVRGAARQSQPGRAGGQPRVAAQRALVDRSCVGCHNARLKNGDLVLENADLANVSANAEMWERVVRKLRAGMMPPPGQRRPEPAAHKAFVEFLESQLDRDAVARPNPGRTETLHRLNRAEYHNVVRDVLDLDIDVTQLLPADDASYGFDNIGGVLKLNQSNLERYLTAAMRVSRAAVGTRPSSPANTVFPVPVDLPQYDRVEGLPFGTRGGTLIHYYFPRDGEYEVTITLTCTTEADLECNGSVGWAQPHELQVLLDDALLKSWVLEPKAVHLTYPNNDTEDGPVEKDQRWKVRFKVTAGPHDVGVTFVKGADVEYVRAGYRKRFERPFKYYAETQFVAVPFVDRVQISGPFDGGESAGDTASRKKIFTCRPTAPGNEAPCARSILTRLARRAYRRPVTTADVDEIMVFYTEGRRQGDFERGVEIAIRRMLASTKFLVRLEVDPPAVKPGTNYRVSDLSLASRLSFFLWSSVPDEELLDAAAKGALQRPEVLERQVTRMLADSKSRALVDNFFGQWLKLRHVESHRPSEALFPDFDASLRTAFRRETELFAEHLIRENRSVLDLLEADYTFVNERLARHYGIPNVQGIEFRKVRYPDDRRRGLLGQGSVLMLTSHAIRTSPVIRGKWVLENVLATPPPPPPPNVPLLPEDEVSSREKAQTMREKMAAHRKNPVCASCHTMIDPAGFALENYDPIGRWRDRDDSFQPLDTTGVLPDGTKFSSLAEFRAALHTHRGRFVSNLTEKLLIYALGRGTEVYDQPAIRKIVAGAAATEYRFSSLVMGIVKSMPFQMRRSDAPTASARR